MSDCTRWRRAPPSALPAELPSTTAFKRAPRTRTVEEMPTKKAARTASEPTGASPVVTSTQTLLAPREPQAQPEETARPAGPSADGPPETSGSERVLDAVVSRVLSTLDVDGLSQEMTCKLADQLLGRVKVDALVTTIMEGQSEALTARLTERLIAQLLGLGR